jgi:predicted ester cyclase
MNSWNTRQLIESFFNQSADLVEDDLVLIDHAQSQVFRGRTTAQALVLDLLSTSFPAAQAEIYTVVEDGYYTVVELIFLGCHCGPFMGIAPTGRLVALPLALVSQRREGKIERVSLYYDAGTLLRQLGLAL